MKNLKKTKKIVSYIILNTLLLLIISVSAKALNEIVVNTNNSGSGSLRQAIINANGNSSVDSIIFKIPTTDANYNSSSGVFRILVTGSSLPMITNDYLVVDGTTQTTYIGNTNTAVLGPGSTVGVEKWTLPKVQGPEIEIVDGGSFNTGLVVSAEGVTIKGLCIYGFGNGFSYNADANILVRRDYRYFHIEDNVVGSPAHQLAVPATSYMTGGNNISISYEANQGVIKNNLVAYAKMADILLYNPDSTYVTGNTIINNYSANYTWGKGILITCGEYQFITGNLIDGFPAEGIDMWYQTKNDSISNNTITNCGMRKIYTSAVRFFDADYSKVHKNIIHGNYGAGVLVTSNGYHITITENSIYENGCVMAADSSSKSKQLGIDLLSSSNLIKTGTYPFYTINDSADWDNGGNTLLNYPVLEIAKIDTATNKLTIAGFARPDSKIEFFIADKCSGSTFPQGKKYLATFYEGSTNDLDTTIDYYCDCVVSGINQGTDKTNRFKFTFTLPGGVSNGTLLTATATWNRNTSEFSGAVEVGTAHAPIKPMLYCVIDNADSTLTAVYSDCNPNNDTITVPVGQENTMINAAQNSGQPTTFYPGTYHDVFRVTFSGSSITWKLTGNTITTYQNSFRCKADMEVTKTVDSPTVNVGDTVHFTIKVKNLSSWVPEHKLIILDTLGDSLSYLTYTASTGIYDPNTGFWSIPFLDHGQTATLTITAIVLGNADNCAYLYYNSQVDNVPNNNSACVSVCACKSSGGNNGGLESNGTLAGKLAKRNYKRYRENVAFNYESKKNLQIFTEEAVRDGLIAPATTKRNKTDLIDFIPSSGPEGTSAYVTTPVDLLGITNAIEIFSVDYFSDQDKRLSAIYAVATEPQTVYEHTKLVCDRVNASSLEDIQYIYVNGIPFILTKLVHPDGELDYAISFIATIEEGKFTIDSRWYNEEYDAKGSDNVYNFQVWSVSPQYTKQLVADIIDLISQKADIFYKNAYPSTIPSVYVRNGYYTNGKLHLNIVNNAHATKVVFHGNYAKIENGERTIFDTELFIDSSQVNQMIEVPVGHVFDVGFSVRNDAVGGIDILYFADGPWGTDHEQGGANIARFEVFPQKEYVEETGKMVLERDAVMEGTVKDYVSLFRVIRVGYEGIDLTRFNQLWFTADGEGTLEIVVAKKGIKNWNDQYRRRYILNSNPYTYKIKFTDLVNNSGKPGFTAEDVTTVVFNLIGDNTSFTPFRINVSNVQFNDGTTFIEPENTREGQPLLKVYPNPFNNSTKVSYYLPANESVELSITGIDGKVVQVLESGWKSEGKYDYTLNANGLEGGVYFCVLRYADKTPVIQKIVLIK